MAPGLKRVTSTQLIEIRTVLSRAQTAFETYFPSSDIDWRVKHSPSEMRKMRTALADAIRILSDVELACGYKEVD
ncbi:hypothetical protein EAS64_33730 [Trebonia kvetii]|uniref:Uncharacterized protein n=1 Tax=Trebonia kvetii TaxID=2480626 RepID=A0A6P2BQC8_9ACTN|nr:hypothetical protein EAS64_33730 [Trebonia kvetii]